MTTRPARARLQSLFDSIKPGSTVFPGSPHHAHPMAIVEALDALTEQVRRIADLLAPADTSDVGEPVYRCLECGTMFASDGALAQHIGARHPNYRAPSHYPDLR